MSWFYIHKKSLCWLFVSRKHFHFTVCMQKVNDNCWLLKLRRYYEVRVCTCYIKKDFHVFFFISKCFKYLRVNSLIRRQVNIHGFRNRWFFFLPIPIDRSKNFVRAKKKSAITKRLHRVLIQACRRIDWNKRYVSASASGWGYINYFNRKCVYIDSND